MHRPDWDEYFLSIARQVSTRATCAKKQHGCVLVRDKYILSTGYNGSPKGLPHCTEVGCKQIDGHCKNCNHAEVNAICSAAKNGINIDGASAYVTGTPCHDCTRTLICAGIISIVFISGGHYKYKEEEEELRKYFIDQSKINYKEIKL